MLKFEAVEVRCQRLSNYYWTSTPLSAQISIKASHYLAAMRILAALSFICIFSARAAFAFVAPNPSSIHRSSPSTSIAAGLFDNIFKAKEQVTNESASGAANNVSVKKQLDALMKKKKFSVLIIASSAKESNKVKQLWM